MSGFRLKRLLRLREQEEARARIDWARAIQAYQRAETARSRGRAEVDGARRELVFRAEAGVEAPSLLPAHSALDALVDQKARQEQALALARDSVAAARSALDESKRAVAALARLEERWLRERKRRQRRRDERDRQEFTARRGGKAS